MSSLREKLCEKSLPVDLSKGGEYSSGGTIVFTRTLTANEKSQVESVMTSHGFTVDAFRKAFLYDESEGSSEPTVITDAALDYTVSARFTPRLRNLAQQLQDSYVCEIDPELLSIVEALVNEGYRTVDYSCAGHEFGVAMLVLDSANIRNRADIQKVQTIIKSLTDVPFTIKHNRSSTLITPDGERTLTRITPNSYVVWFSESML